MPLSDEFIKEMADTFMLGEEFLTNPNPRFCLIAYLRRIESWTTADALAFLELYFPNDPRLVLRPPAYGGA